MQDIDGLLLLLSDHVTHTLKYVEESHGRHSAQKLLNHVTERFDASGNKTMMEPADEPPKAPVSKLDNYLGAGGYSLEDHCVMVAIDGKLQKAKAFGILSAVPLHRQKPMLCFLLVDDSEICGTVREFCRHSYNPTPLYGEAIPSIQLFYNPLQRMSPYDYKLLVDNLDALGTQQLATAARRLNPFSAGETKTTKPVPKLTDVERESLSEIPDVMFRYATEDFVGLLRIDYIDGDWVFHTPTYSIRIDPATIVVTRMDDQRGAYWLLSGPQPTSTAYTFLSDVLNQTDNNHYSDLLEVFLAAYRRID